MWNVENVVPKIEKVAICGLVYTSQESAKNRRQVTESLVKMKEMGNNAKTSQDVIEFFALYGKLTFRFCTHAGNSLG